MIIEDMQIGLGASRRDLERIIVTAPARYKIYDIEKRSGGRRTIAQPARELKQVQYFILENYLKSFEVHQIATAYVEGRSIRHNARIHKNSRFIMKLDFINFFNSIEPKDLDRVLKRSKNKFSSYDRYILKQILFWGQRTKLPVCLSIGAPTSPLLSNLVMFDLDQKMAEQARKNDISLTRYADDITISGNSIGRLEDFEEFVRTILGKTNSPKLSLNDKKRGLYGPGERQMVTGLILTPDGKVSIGRERKRKISAMLHRAILQQLSAEELHSLKGYLAFANSAEPEFIDSMKSKYGERTVKIVMKS